MKYNRKFKKALLPWLLSAAMLTQPMGTAVVYAGEESPAETFSETPETDAADVPFEDAGQTDEDGLISGGSQDQNDGNPNGSESSDTPDGKDNGGDGQMQEPSEEEREDGQEENPSGDEKEDQEQSPSGDEKGEHPGQEPAEGENQDIGSGESQGTEPGGEAGTSEEQGAGEEAGEEHLDSDSSGQEEPLAEKEEDLGEFTGMPDNYSLSSAQVREKRLLADNIEDVDASAEGVLYVEGEVMTLAQSEEEAELIAEAYNAEIRRFEDGLLVLELDGQTAVCDALRAAASSRTLLPAVWPNYYRYVHGEEGFADSFNDPYLKASNSNYQWQHVAVGSPYAWDEGYKGAGVKVAVLDTGANSSNKDLQIQESVNKATGADSAEDGYGHGTHVAGIIGARVNNGIGGAGIAPESEIYSIKVMGDNGKGTDADIIAGLTEAIERDVDVINMSLGGPGYNEIYQRKVNEAYEKGIAVVVSAGNDGVSTINYPACYDHVICVAATDTNNSRASFSTYGAWVDLSAPGADILSTYKTTYAYMSGTSMACPVVAGEAALLLGAYEPLKQMDKNGKKVDELEKIMKSCCVKAAGSGMGAGITSLTKVFKLSTAVTRPTAPVIEIVPDDQNKAQKVTVTIKAQGGTSVYYTDNGKTPSFVNGEPGADAILYSGPFDLENCAKATVKAVAVNENGVCGPVKSVMYTLSPYVADIEISGVQQVAAGKSIQLSAQVSPSYAADKKVKWEIRRADGSPLSADQAGKLKISEGGRVTAAKTASAGKYKVVVTAQDAKKRAAEYEIEVISGVRVKSVRFLKENTGGAVLKSMVLPLTEQETYDFARHLVFEAVSGGAALSAADFKWTSSNKQIAEVDSTTGVLTIKKAGKTTVTALANDSSGKKASCTVTVKQLATDLEITGPASVAAGKSVAFKADVKPKDTANKKVAWSLWDASGEVTGQRAKSLGVSINAANGRVSATAQAAEGSYTVKAVTVDGSQKEAEAAIQILDGSIDKFEFSDRKNAKVTLYRKKSVNDTPTEMAVSVVIKEKGTADLDAYTVSNSKSGIATVAHTRSGNQITLKIKATGKAAGKTNITCLSELK